MSSGVPQTLKAFKKGAKSTNIDHKHECQKNMFKVQVLYLQRFKNLKKKMMDLDFIIASLHQEEVTYFTSFTKGC